MNLIVWDVLTPPGRTVRLRARLERFGPLMWGVAGARLTFRGPVDAERVTDRRGFAEIEFTPPGPGEYRITVQSGAVSAEGIVFCRTADRPAAVLDIDGTLTAEATTIWTPPERSVVKDAGAVAAVNGLAGRYDLIYLTGRRRQQVNATREWLARMGFPPAPLFVQMYPVPVPGFVSGWWKTRTLAGLRRDFPNIVAGVGNAGSDARAYAANGMRAIIFTRRDLPDAERVAAWSEVAARLIPETETPAGMVPRA